MKKSYLLSLVLLTFAFTFMGGNIHAQFTMNPNQSATQLANYLGGPGVVITNASMDCDMMSNAIFTGAPADLGFNDGIFLGSGAAILVPNDSTFLADSSGVNCVPFGNSSHQDAELGVIYDQVNPASTNFVNEYCFLEFDAFSQGDSLTFRYVFGSEEYTSFVCAGFNDIFGFFVTGPNPAGGMYNNVNIALIPGTNTPVAINTVNDGTPNGSDPGCISTNTAFYQGGIPNIAFEGNTVVLEAIIEVIPCETYHYKLAIADGGDCLYDSGVFLEAGSLTASAVEIASAASTSTTGLDEVVEGCTEAFITFEIDTPLTNDTVIPYRITGDAINGVDYVFIDTFVTILAGDTSAVLTITSIEDVPYEPLEQVIISILSDCISSVGGIPVPIDSVIIDIIEEAPFGITPPVATICRGGDITLDADWPGFENYNWSPGTNLNSTTDSVVTATNLTDFQTQYNVTADIGICTYEDSVVITTAPTYTTTISPPDSICIGGATSMTVTSDDPTVVLDSYLWEPAATLNNDNTATVIASPNVTTNYFTTTVSDSGCIVFDTTQVFVSGQAPDLMFNPVSPSFCLGESITLQASSSSVLPVTYSWSPASFLNTTSGPTVVATPDTTITYTVTVDDGVCQGVENLVVEADVFVVDATPSDTTICGSDTIQMNATVAGAVPSCDYTLDMYDSFGDGWTGGTEIEVSIGGVFFNTYSGPTVSFATETFTVPAGETLELFYTAGSLEFDNSYEFYDENGNLLFSDGPTPATGLVYTTITCGGGYTYDWSPVTDISDPTIENPVTYPTATTDYVVAVTNNNNCTYYDTATINVSGSFSIIMPNDTAICPDESIQLTVLGGGQTFAWTPNDGSISDTSISNPFFSPDTTTTYTVLLDSFGCTSSRNLTITVSDVSLDMAAVTDVTCANAMDGVIAITGSNGLPGYLYSIDGGSYVPSSIFNGLDTGTYVTYISDTIGCLDSATVVIVQPDSVEVDAIVVDSVSCNAGADGAISFAGLGGTPAYDYSIDGGTNFSGGNPNFTGLTAGNYQLLVVDVNMCSSAIFNATIDEPTPLLLALDSAKNAQCGSADGYLEVSATGGTPAYSYSINGGAAQATGAFPGLTAIAHEVIVTDANGCADTLSVTLMEDPAATISLVSFDSVSCNGLSDATIEVVGNLGTLPYTFSLDDGTTTVSQADSIFTGLPSGNYTVSIVDANGCNDSLNVFIFEPLAITAVLTPSDVSCFAGADGSIEVSSIANGTPPYEVQFDGGLFVPYITNMTFNNLSIGSYDINITDAEGCPAYSETIVLSKPSQLLVDDTSSIGTSPSCGGEEDGEITVVTNGGGVAPYTYYVEQTQTGDTTSNLTGNFINLGAGIYPIWVIDANGCSAGSTISLTDPPAVVLDVDTVIDESCFGYGDGQIILNTTGGAPPYSHALADGTPEDGPGSFTDLDDGQYTVVATDAFGCTDEIDVLVSQGVVVTANISVDTTEIEMGDTLNVTTSLNSGVGNFVYSWTPSQGLSCSDCANPIILIYNDQEFTVTITDSLGCYDDASVDITVLDELYYFIPSAFTPGNADNQNDDFRVYGQDIKYVEMMVFNRWGEKMFESSNPYVRWDGMYKGVLQQPGVYTYVVKITFLNDKSVEAKGSVSLIR